MSPMKPTGTFKICRLKELSLQIIKYNELVNSTFLSGKGILFKNNIHLNQLSIKS